MTSLLEARGVGIAGRLHPTDVDIAQGEMVGLIGPNGSGKTSLLRALGGVDGEGTVRVDGEWLAAAFPARRSRLIAFMPADRGLVWPIKARDVVALGLPSPDRERVEHLVEHFDLGLLADRPANSLSTGERTRVLLARALAARPRVLLLDEPLSNLDPFWVLRVLEILRDHCRQGSAVVLSLHDLAQAEAFDRVLLLDDGAVVADQPPSGMLMGGAIRTTFGVEVDRSGWRVSLPEDRRSSP